MHCPKCKTWNPEPAAFCSQCGRQLATPQEQAKHASKVKLYGCLALAGGLLLVFIFSAIGSRRSPNKTGTTATSTTTAAKPAAAPAFRMPDLDLLSSKAYDTGYGFHIIEGQVRNASPDPIKGLQAVGIWMAKDGTFITSDDAMIEYDPLLPGQASPFKTMSRTNPEMELYRVEFKRMFGGTVEYTDMRKKPKPKK